jgi:hypothetical protein
MACKNCRKSKKVDASGNVIDPNGINNRVEKPAEVNVAGTNPSTTVAAGCMKMYADLKVLDMKAIKLFNTLRQTNRDAANLFLSLNKQFRQWIVKLKSECPDAKLLEDAKKLIENEYAKHFQS